MSVSTTVNQITQQELNYAPAVLAGVQAAEVSQASGEDKNQAVISAIIAGSKTLEGSPNANVAGIAALIDLSVSIFNALGVFKKKAVAKS